MASRLREAFVYVVAQRVPHRLCAIPCPSQPTLIFSTSYALMASDMQYDRSGCSRAVSEVFHATIPNYAALSHWLLHHAACSLRRRYSDRDPDYCPCDRRPDDAYAGIQWHNNRRDGAIVRDTDGYSRIANADRHRERHDAPRNNRARHAHDHASDDGAALGHRADRTTTSARRTRWDGDAPGRI